MGFAEQFIQGMQAGQQVRQRKQHEADTAEDRQIEKMLLKLKLDQIKIDERKAKRTEAVESFGMMQGQPQANLPADITQTPELPASMAQTALTGGPMPTPGPIPRQAMTIPGVYGPDTQMRPQSMEERLLAQRMAELSKPTKLGAGESLTIPLTGKTIASGAPKPKSYQAKEVMVNGQRVQANFDPDTGSYTDQQGQPIQNAQPAPPQVDPTVAAIRDATLANLRANGGGLTPAQNIRFNQIAGAYERSPLVRAADRTIVMSDAIKSIEQNPTDPAAQLRLAYSYIQALDTYLSAVREGELGNLGALGTKLQLWQMQLNKVASEGAVMPKEVALNIANDAKQLVQTIESGAKRKQQEFASRARVSGVGDAWTDFMSGMASPAGGGAGVTVNGYTFPDQAAADAFKKAAGIP